MQLTEQHKHALERQIVEAIIVALEKDELQVHELHGLANTILGKIDGVGTSSEAMVLLKDLSNQWPFFHHVLEAQKNLDNIG